MARSEAERTTFTTQEADEIRGLLDALPVAPRYSRRMTTARLRRLGVPAALRTSRAAFDEQVATGAIAIDADGAGARALIVPHPSGNVFRVAVGVTGDPIDERWSAFEERYHWFGRQPRAVTSGAHLFVLAVNPWRSAVVALYETVSAGADRLPGSSDPERWPWALGVRPLATIPPPLARPVAGQTAPQSGLPERIRDAETIARMYAAVADSEPPPGPVTLEQRVQELEPQDVAEDVLAAVTSLGREARRPAVIERAIELGGWSAEELEARAWYTGSGVSSHIRHIVAKALDHEHAVTRRLLRRYGTSPYVLAQPLEAPFGVPYRRAGDRAAAAGGDDTAHLVDVAALEKATRRHMRLQDRLADALRDRGVEPRSPGTQEPEFDLAFAHDGAAWVVEVKTGAPATPQQLRIGAGQVLEYRHLLARTRDGDVRAALLLESEPPAPWDRLGAELGLVLLCADDLERSLDALLGPAGYGEGGIRTRDGA